jgi:hypothetical protein
VSAQQVVQQVVAAERLAREWGGTKEETYAMIHKAMAEVPNTDPTKVAALTKRFPKFRNARLRFGPLTFSADARQTDVG